MTELWQTSALEVIGDSRPISEEGARDVSDWTLQQLERKGWCLWRCALFDNNVIAVLRDETIKGFPLFPAFTRWELRTLLPAGPRSWKMAYEIKKSCPGAWIEGFEGPAVQSANEEEDLFGEETAVDPLCDGDP